MKQYLTIKNWAKYQADNKGRVRPGTSPWIKDWTDKDADSTYSKLSVLQRYMLDVCCRLRGRFGRNILNSPMYVARALNVQGTDRPHIRYALDTLMARGFLLLTNQQDDFVEKRRKEKSRKEKNKPDRSASQKQKQKQKQKQNKPRLRRRNPVSPRSSDPLADLTADAATVAEASPASPPLSDDRITDPPSSPRSASLSDDRITNPPSPSPSRTSMRTSSALTAADLAPVLLQGMGVGMSLNTSNAAIEALSIKTSQSGDVDAEKSCEHIIARWAAYKASPVFHTQFKKSPSKWLIDGCYDDPDESWGSSGSGRRS